MRTLAVGRERLDPGAFRLVISFQFVSLAWMSNKSETTAKNAGDLPRPLMRFVVGRLYPGIGVLFSIDIHSFLLANSAVPCGCYVSSVSSLDPFLVIGADLPIAFYISMGVRRGDKALLQRLNDSLERNHAAIQAILAAYHVPVLPDAFVEPVSALH